MTAISPTGSTPGRARVAAPDLGAAETQVQGLMAKAARIVADRSTSSSAEIEQLAADLYAAGSNATRLSVLAKGFEILGPATPGPEVSAMHDRLLGLASVVRREEQTPPGWE